MSVSLRSRMRLSVPNAVPAERRERACGSFEDVHVWWLKLMSLTWFYMPLSCRFQVAFSKFWINSECSIIIEHKLPNTKYFSIFLALHILIPYLYIKCICIVVYKEIWSVIRSKPAKLSVEKINNVESNFESVCGKSDDKNCRDAGHIDCHIKYARVSKHNVAPACLILGSDWVDFDERLKIQREREREREGREREHYVKQSHLSHV